MHNELSQKCQYALRAIFELAKWYNEGPLKITAIAEAQFIPARFLENILNQLKKDGIVDSRRGKTGGYMIACDPAQLSVGHVIELMQGPLFVVECDGGTPAQKCPFEKNCVFWPLWERASNTLKDVYYGTSFADLVREEEARVTAHVHMYAI